MKARKQIRQIEQDLLRVFGELIEDHNTLAKDVDALKDRIAVLEARRIEPVSIIDSLPPVRQIADDKRGIDALFDRVEMYRHRCSNPECNKHLINRLPNGVRCNVCNSPMDSKPVTPRGKRGHYKQRAKVAA